MLTTHRRLIRTGAAAGSLARHCGALVLLLLYSASGVCKCVAAPLQPAHVCVCLHAVLLMATHPTQPQSTSGSRQQAACRSSWTLQTSTCGSQHRAAASNSTSAASRGYIGLASSGTAARRHAALTAAAAATGGTGPAPAPARLGLTGRELLLGRAAAVTAAPWRLLGSPGLWCRALCLQLQCRHPRLPGRAC